MLKVDNMMTDMGALLNQYYDELGFEMSHRTSAVVHETGVPGDEGPPLTEKEVTKWLEKFLRHKIMVLIFIGPIEGVLSLKIYDNDEADVHEITTAPGMMVVLRPDIMSHQHIALGKAMTISSFFIDGHTFQKRHPTGGWTMCPAARELDKWGMERIKVLKELLIVMALPSAMCWCDMMSGRRTTIMPGAVVISWTSASSLSYIFRDR